MGDDAEVTDRRVVVIGAGIAGLTAAWDLGRAGHEVLVLEATSRVGGKLRASEVGGLLVDEGAEAALTRVPEAVELMAALGLGDRIVSPATASASIAVAGGSRPLPTGTLLGVPADLESLRDSGLLSAAGMAAVERDLADPGQPVTGDVAVGTVVRERLGAEVLDRLVEPLLGGVYAGRAEHLSLRATMPALAAQLAWHGSVVGAARAARATPTATGPVFASLPDGLAGLAVALSAALAAMPGVTLRTGVTARAMRRSTSGFRIVTGAASHPEEVTAAGVVVAVPPAKAAVLLREVAPPAAAELAGIESASSALVTLAVPRQPYPAGSGLLVATGASTPPGVRVVKAVTLSSQKWAHLDRGELVILRASVGRRGEEEMLQCSDSELISVAVGELRALIGLAGVPVDARVSRWGGGLPQYDVGHLDRVGRIRVAVEAVPGLAVCGAAYDGVGVPACIRTGHAAADRVRAALTAPGQGHEGTMEP